MSVVMNLRPVSRGIFAVMLCASCLISFPQDLAAKKGKGNELRHPVTRLLQRAPLGSSVDKVARMARRNHFSVKTSTWSESGGMAKGLLGHPNHLGLLNARGVKHPYFDGLPKKGPAFLTVRNNAFSAKYGLVDGKVWSIAFSVNLSAQRDLEYSDPDRVGHIRLVFEELGKLCSKLKVTKKDPYGNPMQFAGENCPNGSLYARYDPTQRDSLAILVFPGKAAGNSAK